MNQAQVLFTPKLFTTLKDYSWKQFRSDVGAGVVVGLVALPLGMAFAIASGLSPERGLYTAIVAGFLISFLGGSRVQIGGPTGAFVIIVGGIVAKFGYEGLAIATAMAGVMLLIMGLSRIGSLIKFIPYPVITGFTSGIAVVIFSSQMKDFFGLNMGAIPIEFVPKWVAYLKAFPTFNFPALLIGVLTAGLIFFWPKSWQKVPGSIIALLATTFLAETFHWNVETIGSRFGNAIHGFPRPVFVTPTWEQIRLLFPSAITVAALGAIESLLSAVVSDGMIGGHHRSNQELVAQGVANMVSPLFGGLPATGAIARTATNVKNGGRTPVAGITHAIVLLLILLMAGPLAARIPLAALAGILVVVSYHMSEWHSFRFLMSGPTSDKMVLLTTFFLTVFVDLVVAVEVGMVLAAFLFMKNMAELTQVKSLTAEVGNGEGDDSTREAQSPANIEIFSIHGAFFFAAVHKLMELDRIIAKSPRALLLDMKEVLHIDASGLRVLDQIRRECKTRGIQFVIAGIHAQPLVALEEANLTTEIGENNITPDLNSALAHVSADTPERRTRPR